ncbi:hypothetical protein AMATHDRAFT_48653 [Amanita thiersii Skay4041]|uniref:G-protein coupled receptors family 1 profile domain-containing protein n=1 Tax=Amanita thiersii Skay4041 TaxID=703135 RepID=A0A2A9NEQ2_9AGAR|nr:hypothetical protein AMATHDRAFT_48653 [Amanita thiersii Skay4041]
MFMNDYRGPMTRIKFIYLFSRYPILLCQIFNCILISTVLNQFPVPEKGCLTWFYAQQFAALTSFTLLDIVLALRVYALHGQNYKIGIVLSCSMAAEMILNSGLTIVIATEHRATPLCHSRCRPQLVIPACAISLAHQLLIWSLTFKKWADLNTVSAATRRICRVVMRDGTWVLIGICGIVATIVPYSTLIEPITHVVFAVMIPMYSSVVCISRYLSRIILMMMLQTCRIILNMHRLSRFNSEATTTSAYELTSFGGSEEM